MGTAPSRADACTHTCAQTHVKSLYYRLPRQHSSVSSEDFFTKHNEYTPVNVWTRSIADTVPQFASTSTLNLNCYFLWICTDVIVVTVVYRQRQCQCQKLLISSEPIIPETLEQNLRQLLGCIQWCRLFIFTHVFAKSHLLPCEVAISNSSTPTASMLQTRNEKEFRTKRLVVSMMKREICCSLPKKTSASQQKHCYLRI